MNLYPTRKQPEDLKCDAASLQQRLSNFPRHTIDVKGKTAPHNKCSVTLALSEDIEESMNSGFPDFMTGELKEHFEKLKNF
jgi:hypothetical protein